ncbi:MAG: hypothetical protein AAF763_12545 [Pseudomonadota bacterium]
MIRTASTAALAAAPAQAVTTTAIAAGGGANGDIGGANVNPVGEDAVQGAATVTVTGNPASTTDYRIAFSDNPVTAWIEFTTSSTFDLLLVDFEDDASGGSDVTGYLLDRIGTPNTRLTTETAFCSDAVGFAGAGCNLIADGDAAGGNVGLATKDAASPVVLLSNLMAGSYRLGLFDSATPNPGSATFRVSEVPAPMAGLMLVSALGLWRVGSRKSA